MTTRSIPWRPAFSRKSAVPSPKPSSSTPPAGSSWKADGFVSCSRTEGDSAGAIPSSQGGEPFGTMRWLRASARRRYGQDKEGDASGPAVPTTDFRSKSWYKWIGNQRVCHNTSPGGREEKGGARGCRVRPGNRHQPAPGRSHRTGRERDRQAMPAAREQRFTRTAPLPA